MAGEESSYPEERFRIAEKDLNRVHRALAAGDPELAGFCLQQAVEKFLKGFLLRKGWKLKRLHNLETLLDEALTYRPDLGEFRPACRRITAYYLLERYPFVAEAGPVESEVKSSVEEVRPLLESLRQG